MKLPSVGWLWRPVVLFMALMGTLSMAHPADANFIVIVTPPPTPYPTALIEVTPSPVAEEADESSSGEQGEQGEQGGDVVEANGTDDADGGEGSGIGVIVAGVVVGVLMLGGLVYAWLRRRWQSSAKRMGTTISTMSTFSSPKAGSVRSGPAEGMPMPGGFEVSERPSMPMQHTTNPMYQPRRKSSAKQRLMNMIRPPASPATSGAGTRGGLGAGERARDIQRHIGSPPPSEFMAYAGNMPPPPLPNAPPPESEPDFEVVVVGQDDSDEEVLETEEYAEFVEKSRSTLSDEKKAKLQRKKMNKWKNRWDKTLDRAKTLERPNKKGGGGSDGFTAGEFFDD